MRWALARAVPVGGLIAAVLLTGCDWGGHEDRKDSPAQRLPGKVIITRSPDSLAPRGAPAHWLPPESWVYNHWLPFDERRLYALLGITREILWDQLRDDRRTLAQLAARRGWPDSRRLASALVAPEHPAGSGPSRKLLEARAVRAITQGHLAQHLFFHSLHQFAIPSEAPKLFGVTDVRFRELRREELSPLTVAQLHGRSPGQVEALAIAVLRDRMDAGVRGGEMPLSQGRRLLRRQLAQLPRWLGQARYNGPPPTTRGALLAVPADYASNPVISGDGRFVAYEAYRQKLPLALRFGEIAVMRTDLRSGRSTLVSPLGDGHPVSEYNPTITGDGARVAYESSAGNENFGKRYGRIGIRLTELPARRTRWVSPVHEQNADVLSDYNPVLAAHGGREAYQTVHGGRTAIAVRDLASGRRTTAAQGAPMGRDRFADVYDPGLSADGTKLVFTRAAGRVSRPRSATSDVRVRDLRTGRTTVIRERRDGFATGGALSPDGRWVAYTTGRAGGRLRLQLRDLLSGRTTTVPTHGARVLDPVVSRRSRAVAFTALRGSRSQVEVWRRGSRTSGLVSRAPGTAGDAADRGAADPSISDDGRRVAFVSAATNLASDKTDGKRAVFVRDVQRATTQLVSDTAAAYPPAALARFLAKAKAAGAPAPARPNPIPRPPLAANEVAIVDNAFFATTDRPTVRIRAGQAVTWKWAARGSHSLAVESGPERFATRALHGSRLTHRFQRPGTYDLVCSLHAPGMRMTVVVE